MKENKKLVSHAGNSLTLLGQTTIVGQLAPDFTAIDKNGLGVSLSDFKGKIVVVTVFPSIDTSVCARQTHEFNRLAVEMGSDVVLLSVSRDLPFALARFCGAEGIDRVFPLSDFKECDFGLKYGFLIKESQLLARGVVIIDPHGVIRYVEYVSDLVNEPNYEQAMEALKKLKSEQLS
ncbi:MAG: thiol peroxidase [Mucinivorans sp.]